MDKKIINNAISAYMWLWALLLLPSKKEAINNSFVKKHAKTALFIHFLMLITYIIFIKYSFLQNIKILNFTLNDLIASSLLIILSLWLFYWAFKAKKQQELSLWDIVYFSKWDKLFEIKKSNLNEEWILTIILSFIPFVWFYIYSKFKNYNSPILSNNVKLNLLISIFLTILLILWYINIFNFLFLIYIIFIVFSSIFLISKERLININFKYIPTFEELYIYSISIINYLKNYFSKNKKFTKLQDIITISKENYIKENNIKKEYIKTLKQSKIPDFLIYIPFVNIITIIDKNSINKYHIINGLSITILSLIFILISKPSYILFLIFIISFSFWYLQKKHYSIPFLYDIYKMLVFVFKKVFFLSKTLKEKQKEEKSISFKWKNHTNEETSISSLDNFK